jgi:hypothetical protein
MTKMRFVPWPQREGHSCSYLYGERSWIWFLSLVFLCSCSIAISTCSSAVPFQFRQGASLVGQIRDRSGAAVAHAIVELYSQSGEKIQQTVSNDDGTFGFGSVEIGDYFVKVTIPGFGVTGAQAHIRFGESSRLEITVNPEETSAASPASSEPPVYNALFSPTPANKPTHLLNGKKSELRFYIGPKDERNALSIGQWTVNPGILKDADNVPLTVTMTCMVCRLNRVQSRVITFSGKDQKSSEARFSFVPTASLAKKDRRILVDVMSRGVELNHLAITVQIDSVGTEEQTTVAKEPKILNFGGWNVPEQPGEVPDLILTLGRDGDGSINLKIEPVLEELAKKLGNQYLDNGEFRTFKTNLTDAVMQAALQKTSVTLRGFVDQENDALQKVLAQSVGGAQDINFDGQVQMGTDDEKTVLASFFALGSFAYYKLFREGGSALGDIADKLDSLSSAGRPLRVLIRSNGIGFPWQLLHNDRDVDQRADGFWGFRYAITADYLGRAYGGPLPSAFDRDNADYSVFGEYRASPGEAPVVAVLAQRQAAYFQANWKSTNFATADSSQTFLDSIRQHRGAIDFLMVYAHGSSGSIITKLPNGTLVIEDEAAGPRMMFSQTENMLPYDLEGLPVGTVLNGEAYLSRQPIILLNACDTGSSALGRDTKRLTLPVAFLDIGARGVVATEAPVWNIFAYQFGNELISQIVTGSPVGSSLLAVRKKFLDSYNNPFGLLYSYYGSAGAKVLARGSS